jgi:hypothetical protein
MAFPVEKSKCVLWFKAHNFAVMLQRKFRTVFGREAPLNMSCYELFDQTGCIFKEESPGGVHSLKFKWMNFKRRSFSCLRPNQAGMLPENETRHKHTNAQYSVESFGI